MLGGATCVLDKLADSVVIGVGNIGVVKLALYGE